MIEIFNLVKTYNKGSDNEVIALQQINLCIGPQELLVVVGANGSGKSTLLNIIAGSISPTKGIISFEGHDVTELKDFERSKWVARVFQNPLSGTASGLSVIDNFRLAALRTRTKHVVIGIDNAFRKSVQEKIAGLSLGLETKLDTKMGALSGGQRQALTLLMSVMDECKILLLDEPTAALDPRSADIIMKLTDRLIRDFKLTAILVTHNLKEAYIHGNRIIQMANGQVIRALNGDDKNRLEQVDMFKWFA